MTELNEIKQAAFKILARREYSRAELLRKLKHKFPETELELFIQALDQLGAKNFQSDVRFAESRIRHRANLGYGPNYIRQELKQQGVADDIIQQAMQDSGIDWYEVASNQYQKHFSKPIADSNDRLKRQRYLYARGFSQDIIRSFF
jgi:regulatory protein